MNSNENKISYSCTNTYSTLGSLSEKTKSVWFVCHGMGHLSRYFIRNFELFKQQENYIIAPQAQSKYYLPTKRKHVGSSWLTKENTLEETENVLRYFDAVLINENIPKNLNLNILGYSQGVSVAMRYAASREIQFEKLVLVSGGIPNELTQYHFKYLNKDAKIHFVYGTEDEYLTETRIESETKKLNTLFGNAFKIHSYQGNHDFNPEKWIHFID